jgi:hypothetical protein
MTREQVLAMTAQELAEATAVHVMGWQWQQLPSIGNVVERGYWWSLSLEEPVYDWSPAEDISAAWEVEEKIKTMDIEVVRRYVSLIYDLSGYGFVAIHASPADRCKAALLAVMGI